MICNMIHNSDTSQPGGLTLPDESEVLGWGQLDFSNAIQPDLEAGDAAYAAARGETIGAFMTATDTTFNDANRVGRCVFIRIKHIQGDTDIADRFILPFLLGDTVLLVELQVYIYQDELYVDCMPVASVGSIAESATSADNIVYEPILYAK